METIVPMFQDEGWSAKGRQWKDFDDLQTLDPNTKGRGKKGKKKRKKDYILN